MTKVKDIELPDKPQAILEELQKEDYPLPLESLQARVEKNYGYKLDKRQIKGSLGELNRRGYDTKTIIGKDSEKIVLVRYADEETEKIYRPLGKIETPLMLTGDFHIGHKAFSEQAFNFLLDDIDDYEPNAVMLVGDILQGLGVHRLEAKDIIQPDIDSQVMMAKDYLEQIDVPMYSTLGNHEEKLKGEHKKGFDALMYLSNMVDNLTYYGSVAEFTLNDEYRYVMMHGGGGQAYSRSYSLQKIWRNLPSPRPDIVHIGHYHILQPVPMAPNRMLICSGTLQRESSYIIWRGKTTQVGYYILEDYHENGDTLKRRVPTTY